MIYCYKIMLNFTLFVLNFRNDSIEMEWSFMDFNQIETDIESVREQLNNLIAQNGQAKKILHVSEKLDILINLFYGSIREN